MAIIAVDGLSWSGRDEVARRLATALGWPLVGPEELADVADHLGVDGEEFLERVERPYGLRQRFADFFTFAGLGNPGMPNVLIGVAAEAGSPLMDGLIPYFPLTPSRMRAALHKVVTWVTGAGPTVLVGAGAQHVLRGTDDVLRVFLVASKDVRARFAMEALEVTLDEAIRRVEQADAGSRRFLRQVFGLKRHDPSDYDLVLDTGAVSAVSAASLVLTRLGQHPGIRSTDTLQEQG